jgi:hypothetical protein
MPVILKMFKLSDSNVIFDKIDTLKQILTVFVLFLIEEA